MKRRGLANIVLFTVVLLISVIFVDIYYYENSGSYSSRIVSLEIKQCSWDIPVSSDNYDRNCICLRKFHQDILPSDLVSINSQLFIEINNQSKLVPLKYIPEKNILILEEEMPHIGIYEFNEPEYFFKLQIIFSSLNKNALENISRQSILNGKIWKTHDNPIDIIHFELDKTILGGMHRSEIYYFGMELHFEIEEDESRTEPSHLLPFY